MKSTGALALSLERSSSPNHTTASTNRPRARSTPSDVYARPDVYDMEYAGASNHDGRFFAQLLARVRPRRVLELACGSGRVTFTLAAALPVAEIVGVDSSIDMLAPAPKASEAADSLVRRRVSFSEGDIRDWRGTGDPFDAVVIACCRCRTCSRSMIGVGPGPRRFACSALAASSFDIRVPDLATLAEAQRARPHAFVDLDIDATRWPPADETPFLRCPL